MKISFFSGLFLSILVKNLYFLLFLKCLLCFFVFICNPLRSGCDNSSTAAGDRTTATAEQSTSQPIGQSADQPIVQSADQSIDQSANQPIVQSANPSIDQSADYPTIQSIHRPHQTTKLWLSRLPATEKWNKKERPCPFLRPGPDHHSAQQRNVVVAQRWQPRCGG